MPNSEYTPDLYTLIDEDGKEQTFEMLDVMEVEDNRYFALIPYYDEAKEILEESGELVILKADMVGDEETLVSIEDDDEFEKIGQMFLERLDEMFDEDCDCCDDDDCDCECGCCEHDHE